MDGWMDGWMDRWMDMHEREVKENIYAGKDQATQAFPKLSVAPQEGVTELTSKQASK